MWSIKWWKKRIVSVLVIYITRFRSKPHQIITSINYFSLSSAGEPAPGPQPARQPAADARELPLPHLGLVQLCTHTAAEKVS